MLLVLLSLGSRSLSRAVSIEPEEILIGVDGDSAVSAEMIGKYSLTSELLSHWLIISMLQMSDVGQVGRTGRTVQGLYDMMNRGTSWE